VEWLEESIKSLIGIGRNEGYLLFWTPNAEAATFLWIASDREPIMQPAGVATGYSDVTFGAQLWDMVESPGR
jgi:hypothetical protein